MDEEIFGVINDADELMESISCDPFGMNTITILTGIYEGMSISKNSLDNPKTVEKIKKQLKSAKRWESVLTVIQKLNMILVGLTVVGGTAATRTYKENGRNARIISNNAARELDEYTSKIDAINQHKMDTYRETIKEYERQRDSHDIRDKFVDLIDGNPTKGESVTTVNGEKYYPGIPRPKLVEADNDKKIKLKIDELHYKKVADEAPKKSDAAFKFTITVLLINIAVAVLTSLLKAAIHRKELKNISKVKGQIDKSIILYKSKMFYASEDDRKRLEEAIKNLEEIDEMLISNKNYYMDDDTIQ